ncbi:MAG TPA: hypothetical protein VHC90_07320 [Bryobacteraceae bacterium]|nr:hypothetical protein [Bryobacteraceae bacterium]
MSAPRSMAEVRRYREILRTCLAVNSEAPEARSWASQLAVCEWVLGMETALANSVAIAVEECNRADRETFPGRLNPAAD